MKSWSLLDARDSGIVILSTIGFGDLTPETLRAKSFTIIYVINRICILLALFDRICAVRTREVLGTTAGETLVSASDRQGEHS